MKRFSFFNLRMGNRQFPVLAGILYASFFSFYSVGIHYSVDIQNSETNLSDQVDHIVKIAMTEKHIPGVAVAVTENGKVLLKKTYGVKSQDSKASPDENTVFSMGSISKAMTAIGIMTLIDQKRIASLDDPAGKYLKILPKSWQKITIKQFMTHTSGIPDLKGVKTKASFEESMKRAATLKPPLPGQTEKYNNFNFAVMGKLIETVSRMSYLDYMKKNVFDPAGMKFTGLKPATKNTVTGYTEGKDGRMKPVTTHFDAGDYGIASGGLQTTLANFMKLDAPLRTGKVLQAASLKQMLTPLAPDKGFTNTPGWHSYESANTLVISKNGGGTGVGCSAIYTMVPSRNLTIILLANKFGGVSTSSISDEILNDAFGIVHKKGKRKNEEDD